MMLVLFWSLWVCAQRVLEQCFKSSLVLEFPECVNPITFSSEGSAEVHLLGRNCVAVRLFPESG